MKFTSIVRALKKAGFVVKENRSAFVDMEDHSVEIVNTNLHITVHPDGLYFTVVEEEGSGANLGWYFHEVSTLAAMMYTVRSKIKVRATQ